MRLGSGAFFGKPGVGKITCVLFIRDTMKEPKWFEKLKDRANFRPTGEFPIEKAAQLVTDAIVYAREQQIRNLLVDIRGLSGFDPPNVLMRNHLIREWARVSGSFVRVVFVAPEEMIHPEKVGVKLAASRGMVVEIFTTEPEALAWLKTLERD
jgi:hypothetical protein